MADPSETTQISRGAASQEGVAGSDTAELLSAIHELSARVGSLQSEVQTLRAHSRSLPGGAEPAGWDDPRSGPAPNLTWVSALDAPSARSPAVPRLLLEIVFLVAVAVGAAIAELEVAEIVGVMTIAWALVALAEWASARAARQRADAVYAPLSGFSSGFASDPSWFAPPVERTILDTVETDEDTETRLPPPSGD